MGRLRGATTSGAALLVMTALAASAAGATVWSWGDARELLAARDPASLLLAATEVTTALLLGRCALGGALAVAALAGRRLAGRRPGSGSDSATARAAVRVTPALLRPVVSALLTLSVTTGVAGPALAASNAPTLPPAAWSAPREPHPTAGEPSTAPAAALPSAGWVPTVQRPTHSASPSRLVAGIAHRTPPAADVVVHRGDSLWAIVARALGPHASDARVAAEWPRWYAANQPTIGDDPDLLRPGTILHPPARAASR